MADVGSGYASNPLTVLAENEIRSVAQRSDVKGASLGC